ncbi:MAG: TldD/PmbA family protein [Candidatus Anammoxibacter sp.]
MIESYKQLAKDVIKIAQDAGAELVTVSIGNSRAFELEVRNKQTDVLKQAGSSGINISVCKDHKRSSVFSNDLRLETIESLISSTMKVLPYMGIDEFYTLPEVALQGSSSGDLKLIDADFDNCDSSEKVKNLILLEEKTLSLDSRLKTEQAYHTDSISHNVYADSNGFIGEEIDTFYTFGMSALVEDKTEKGENKSRKQTDGWHTCSRFYDKLEKIEKIAQESAKRILRKIGAVKPKSQEVPIVFSVEMACSFIGNVASAMMGGNIFRKNSFLVDCIGTKIANKQICLRDDPLLPGKMGSRYFDNEGVESKPLSLVENGILKTYMLSTYSGNKLKMKTTGHAGGISNLILEPGKYTEDELIASVDNGLYLTSMSGQGANITTGDYSRGAQGIWIRDGKLAEPVAEFTIAGKFIDMLNNIIMIANEVDERSVILTPAFKIDSMAISGE